MEGSEPPPEPRSPLNLTATSFQSSRRQRGASDVDSANVTSTSFGSRRARGEPGSPKGQRNRAASNTRSRKTSRDVDETSSQEPLPEYLWRAVGFATEAVRGNKDLMLRFVKLDWRALRFATDEVRGDAAVVGAAVDQDYRALKFAAEAAKVDRRTVLRAVKQCNPLGQLADWRALEYASFS